MTRLQEFRQRHKKELSEKALAWRASNGHKMDAHYAVKKALRSGEITRPTTCVKCDIACSPDAHHSDYSQPLNIEWLCKKCHHKAHGTMLKTTVKKIYKGEDSVRHKLTEAQVIEIRKILKDGLNTIAALARLYQMSESAIRLIAKGKTWKHLIKQ